VDNEIELVSDGDGVAVIGELSAVERFIEAAGLAAMPGTRIALGTGASVAQAGAEIASNSGRWVKLTKESAQNLKRFPLTPTDTPGVSHAMLGQRGSIKKWLQIENPTALARNPAMLSGAAGVMAQMAMQQTMDEIIAYLASIDAKLDDVLRAQTNQVLARLDGVDLAVREAMSVRAAVGRVSEVTWSKVQNSAQTIHETQGYALRQLAERDERRAGHPAHREFLRLAHVQEYSALVLPDPDRGLVVDLSRIRARSKHLPQHRDRVPSCGATGQPSVDDPFRDP